MAAETWLDAKDALDLGFADRIAEPVRIAARFDVGRFRNAPSVLAEVVVDADEANPEHNAVADADDEDEDEETASDATTGNETLGAPETFGTDKVLPTDAAPAPEAVCTVAAANDAANAASIRADALTHARAVVDLCRLAGQPQMAGRFLERDTGLDDVRAALLALRADAEPDISAAHPQPGRPSDARPWGDVIARTFRLKG